MTEGASRGTPKRKRRGRTAAVVLSAAALLLLVSCAVLWLSVFRAPAVSAGKPVQIEIPKGASTQQIAGRLVANGVVGNANMFRLRARLDGADGKFKPGVYDLSTGMDYETVIMRLEEGPPLLYYTVTIPEGFTLAQIAERVQAKTGIPAAEFERLASKEASRFAASHGFLRFNSTPTLEGYLFPKTYRVKKGATAADVIEMMLDQFGKETQDVDMSYAASKGLTPHDVVSIASMIERETRLAKERPIVSSVIYNRLDRGMRLEIDATVQYVVGNKKRLLYSDLRVQSPYNTYLHKGLPPGPIASPGLPSIEAAAHPRSSGYIYYVLTGRDGSHTFTKDRDAFLKAKQRGVR